MNLSELKLNFLKINVSTKQAVDDEFWMIMMMAVVIVIVCSLLVHVLTRNTRYFAR